MLHYISRTSRVRILAVIVIFAVVGLWLSAQDVLPTPRVGFKNYDLFKKPLLLDASCESSPPVKANKLSETLFPVLDPAKTESWVGENHKMLRALLYCMESSNCSPNQNKVVILGSFHFIGLFWPGNTGGEDIWAKSTVQALRDMGYTFLYAPNFERIVQIYQMMPDLVKAVIVEASDSHVCFADEEYCIMSSLNPEGIPAWKIFSFHFWGFPDNPLGGNWTLSPENYSLEGSPNNYLGYSVEPSCMLQPFIPHEDREDRAYVMGKWVAFLLEDAAAWPPHFFGAVSNTTGIKFIIGALSDDNYPNLPPGMINHGLLPQPAFLESVARSRFLVGVGSPPLSPSPYDALCLGVPFINPILDWDHDHPQDRSKWNAQQPMLRFLDPPYVYNVFRSDLDGFIDATKNIISRPIDRHVLEHMRMSSVVARFRAILERDWKSEAAELLAQRKASGEGPLFTV